MLLEFDDEKICWSTCTPIPSREARLSSVYHSNQRRVSKSVDARFDGGLREETKNVIKLFGVWILGFLDCIVV